MKVLLISYYWPPAGGAGVQRWLKMSKYLSDFGIELYVYTPSNGEFPGYDESQLSEVDPRIKLIKQPIWEPYALYKKFLGIKKDQRIYNGFLEGGHKKSFKSKLVNFIRANFFIPDARFWWIRPSVKFLKSYLQAENIDTIISTGPPHSMHLIGLRLKKSLKNLRWVADFRDPWTDIDYFHQLPLTAVAKALHKSLEKKVLMSADRVVTVSEPWAKDLAKIRGAEVELIFNGYDPQDFEENQYVLDAKFTLKYFGSMNNDRNLPGLWRALASLVKENGALAEQLNIVLVGEIAQSIKDDINQNGLNAYLTVSTQKPHKEVVIEMKSAHILLLAINATPNELGIIPGKMFEYMGAGRPILCLGQKEGASSGIIKETKAGDFFYHEDVAGIKNFILEAFLQNVSTNEKADFQKFSRKTLAGQYAELLKQL